MGRVIVVGSVNQDITVTVDRFPQPGETLSGTSTTYRLGGKGANQAAAAAHGGATTLFVGRVGGDAAGITLREELHAHGVDVSALRTDEEVTTGIAFITVSAAGENTIILDAGANSRVTGEQAAAEVELTPDDVVVLQGEIPRPPMRPSSPGRTRPGRGSCSISPPSTRSQRRRWRPRTSSSSMRASAGSSWGRPRRRRPRRL